MGKLIVGGKKFEVTRQYLPRHRTVEVTKEGQVVLDYYARLAIEHRMLPVVDKDEFISRLAVQNGETLQWATRRIQETLEDGFFFEDHDHRALVPKPILEEMFDGELERDCLVVWFRRE